MGEQPVCSENSGSEARPNTPTADLDLCSDLDFFAADEKEDAVEKECEKDYSKTNNTDLVNEIREILSGCEQHSRCEQQKRRTRRFSNASPSSNLPPLDWRNGVIPKSRQRNSNEGRFHSKNLGLGSRYQPMKEMNISGHNFGLQGKSNKVSLENKDPREKGMNCKKSVASLPKIDTYCISYDRPRTNHGFSYVVSANDLIKTRNADSNKKENPKRTFGCSMPEKNSLKNSGNVYLLFQAPSRARGSKAEPFLVTAQPKEPRRYKQRRVKECKEIKANIVSLPDISEGVWK